MFDQLVEQLEILYEDNHVIVVKKYPNVLSQRDRTSDFSMLEIIKQYIKVNENKPGNVYLGLVHRLDRRVGGLMVFAKTSKAAARLSEQIRNHKINRQYIACISGRLYEKRGTLKDYLIKKRYPLRAEVATAKTNHSKLAILDYEVINYSTVNNEVVTYVHVNLQTGRYNQIRIQFSHLGYPLLGDYKYGYRGQINDDFGLWCYKLAFSHPTTKEKLSFTLYPKSAIWSGLSK